MIRFWFATLALGLMLMGGCAQRSETVRSESHTESSHSQEGAAPGADMAPGASQSSQSETRRTLRETTTTTEIERR